MFKVKEGIRIGAQEFVDSSRNVTAGTITASDVTISGALYGPATMYIDPAGIGDNTGTLVIRGNLQVDGTTTTINSTTVAIDDLNLQLAADAPNAAAANGAGISVGGASATLTYTSGDDRWNFNKSLNVDTSLTISGTTDGLINLNKSSGSNWNYINFNYQGTRKFYFGLNGSLEPELATDNSSVFRVPGSMTVGGLTITSSFNTRTNDVYADMRVIRSGGSDGMYIGYSNNSSGPTRIFGGGSTSGEFVKNSDHSVEPGSFRAPIFYDSDDTAYYVDPNSTTTSLNVNGSISINNGGASNTHGLKLTGANSRIWFDGFRAIEGDISGANFQIGEGYSYTTIYNQTRSPIFYDSNDTAYYLNPRHESRLSGLRLDGIDNEAAGSGSDAILWINKPNNNDWAITVGGGLEYGLNLIMASSHTYAIRALAGGSEYSRLGSDLFYHNNQLRAPIFYDYNDTGYYADPNSNSKFVNLGLGGATPDVRLSISGDEHISGILYIGGTAGSVNSWASRDYTSGSSRYFNASAYEFNNYGYGSTWNFYLASSYALHTSSVRAPIFYDSNDTNFYADPAGTSKFNRLETTVTSVHGPKRSYYVGNLTADGAQARRFEIARIYIDYNDWHSAGIFQVEIHNNYFFGGDYQLWNISYDYNNVSCNLISGDSPRGRYGQVTCSSPVQISGDYYYISVYVDVRYYGYYYGIVHTSWPETTTHQAQGGNVLVYTSPSVSNISDFTPTNTITTTNIISSTSDIRAPIFYDLDNTGYYFDGASTTRTNVIQTNYIGVNQAYNSSWRLIVNGNAYLNGGGYGQAEGSWRAPIFYDSNDTAYFLDPAGSSFLNSVSVNVGNENTGAGNGSTSGLTLRGNYNSNTWAHKFHKYDNGGGVPLYLSYTLGASSWIALQGWGSGLSYTSHLFGSFAADSAVFSPIFYDKDNTGYYLDPNSTTSIRTVGSWRSDSSTWDGEFSGKIQYHSNSWYLQAADAWYFRNSAGTNVATINSSGYIFGSYFNAGSGNSENPTIGQIWTQNTGDNYLRKSTPAHFISQLGLVTTSVLDNNDRTYLTDSRGAARLPSYYDDRYAQWDFQNTSDTGAGGDTWHGLLTVAKWTVYDASHRQEQIAFTGNDLKRRTATSDSAWGSWKTIWDSGNLTNINQLTNGPGYITSVSFDGLTSKTGGTGTYQTSGDFRAPIFYDSNDTGYYVDPTGTTNLNNLYIQGGVAGVSNSSSYTEAAIEVRERNFGGAQDDTWATAPRIGFHWGGRVASQIAMSSGGTISILNNPGNAYENFRAANIYGQSFIDSDNTSYYLDPASTTTSLQVAGTIEQGNRYAHPNIDWGASGTSTGMVIFYIPGTTGNYGMVHMVFDIYEYDSPRTATVIIGGHNWNGGWYSTACNVVGYTDKQVRLGVKDGRYVVVFGTSGSSWSYGQIRLRKIQNGSYYDNVMDLGGNWSTTQTTTESFSNISGDLRGFRTPTALEVDGIIYGYSQLRTPIYYDYNDTGYYCDPNGSSRLNDVFPNQIYNYGWFRNQSSGNGLYNTANDAHFYSAGPNYWHINPDNGSVSIGGLIFYDQYNSTQNSSTGRKGSVYWDSAGFGLLDSTGNWSVNIHPTNYARVTIGGHNGINPYDGVTGIRLMFGGGDNTAAADYYIGTNLEYFGGTYNKLDLRWHTGIRIGAQPNYGGVRIYDSEDMGTIRFSVNKGDANTRVETGDFYAANLYDRDNTSYYIDPPGTNRVNVVHANYFLGEITDSGSGDSNAPFRFESDYSGWVSLLANTPGAGNGWGTFWAGNDNPAYRFFDTSNPNEYVFVGAGVARASIDLDNGQSWFDTSVRSPIFYDSNDTGYYIDPNSTSNSALRMRGGALFGPNVTWGASLYVGTDGRPGTSAAVAVTNGNLHLDSQNGYQIFLNWYSGEPTWTGGNLGVGSSSASHRLHVHGTGLATSDFRAPLFYDDNNTGYYLDPNSTSRLNRVDTDNIYNYGWFRNYNAAGLYNESYGNHWYATGNDYWNLAGNNSGNVGIIFRTGGFQGTSRGYVYADSSNNIGFLNSAGSWRLRVVGDDYSLADGSSMRAQIFYDSNDTTYYADFASSSTSVNTRGAIVSGGSGSTGGGLITINGNLGSLSLHPAAGATAAEIRSSASLLIKTNTTSVVASISTSGIVSSGSITAFGSPSDRNLKENIIPLTNSLEKVRALQGVSFNWKKDTQEHTITGLDSDIGLIAQNVQEIFPELVRDQDGTLTLRERGLIAVLVEAVKEQDVKIKQLEALVETLVSKLGK